MGDNFQEALSDWSEDNMGINITYKFDLAITDNRKDLYKMMHKTINLKESQLMNFMASNSLKYVENA